MAIDNLNYYSSWLPAWQQTDKYTSQPWCLKSKNLDIFSSSKSVKATAWSAPSAWEADVIAIDDRGNLVLKTDWKVYDRSSWTETLLVDPSTNFPVHQASYNWKNGTYDDAQRGTVLDMVVKYEWDEWKSFVVFTDKASYTYSKVKYTPAKSFSAYSSNLTLDPDIWGNGYQFKKNTTTWQTSTVDIALENSPFAKFKIRVYAVEPASTASTISLNKVRLYEYKYYYDAELEAMTPANAITTSELAFSWTITDWFDVEIPTMPAYANRRIVQLEFKYTTRDWQSGYWWSGWELYIDMNWWPETNHFATFAWWTVSDWDFNEYYSYLPVRDRRLTDIWEYYWMPALSFQTLYNWEWVWADINWEKKTRYDFVQYMWWANDTAMEIISMIAWNESIYMIGNMNWNWYIFPCDLTWQRWTPFIAYWCTFKWATNIDYLLYLVWEDRGISQLWVYNGQELVPLLWWNLESWTVDYVNSDEQYNFDWKMVEYRGNLVLATTDGRIFEYWQTYWGKWGAFIHDLKPSDHNSLTIDKLQAKGNDLIVSYTTVDTVEWIQVTTKWVVTYCDDVVVGRIYNNEWEAVYPIVLGNHLLEKEESDLYASYILPDWDTHLEFWGCANHYHFWTFKTSQYLLVEDPAWTHRFGIKGTQGDYYLEFVERVESPDWLDWYTFRLVWSLPLMAAGATNTVIYLDDDWETLVDFIKFSEVNHFRKIWDVYPDTFTFEDEEYWKYTEWEFRFHNLNNKLELPKSHSLQVKVIGYWTNSHTPELFALDLVANQRDRW